MTGTVTGLFTHKQSRSYEGHLESKERFAIKKYLLIIGKKKNMQLIFVVPCIMLNSETNPTRCHNCVYSSQWLYSTCFG